MPGCGLYLFGGEVLDRGDLERLLHIAKVRMHQFCPGWQCCKHRCLGITLRNDVDGLLMQHHEIAVGQVVFGSKGVWRIDGNGCNKSSEADSCQQPPLPKVMAP